MMAADFKGNAVIVFEGKAKFIPAEYLEMNVFLKVQVDEQDEFSEEVVQAMDAEVDAYEELVGRDYELEIWKVYIN
nr:MAG TPA: hypothetical protein [Caudoviricetes sp.]